VAKLCQNWSPVPHALHSFALNPHLTKTRLNDAYDLCETQRWKSGTGKAIARDSVEVPSVLQRLPVDGVNVKLCWRKVYA
jgi:hypothetical protein